ncbi:hypothetical protein HS088_TW23G00321 [Tripterygium wilfordii]|uniref:Uncharacterized protein n=1 Tax=Tripterygium wilfordii TaxID=458696 RepID=A0A7J7BVF0_TRIWF|nr:hypothetical protein HS088_TW23G00321 [Tripterygium wilfordii]
MGSKRPELYKLFKRNRYTTGEFHDRRYGGVHTADTTMSRDVKRETTLHELCGYGTGSNTGERNELDYSNGGRRYSRRDPWKPAI